MQLEEDFKEEFYKKEQLFEQQKQKLTEQYKEVEKRFHLAEDQVVTLREQQKRQLGSGKDALREEQKNSKQKKEDDQIERLKSENQKLQHKINDLKNKLKNTKQANQILETDLVTQYHVTEKAKKKYESELKNLRNQTRMSEKEQVNEKDKEIKVLIEKTGWLLQQLDKATKAKESMERNLQSVYNDTDEV